MTHIKHYNLTGHKGRMFFTTDVHGSFDLLHEAMKNVSFDTSKDILFVGGDNCDRGANSDWILDYINEPWYASIAGNHEDLVIGAYEEALADTESPTEGGGSYWATRCLMSNGGKWWFEQPEDKQKAIYESFKALPLAIELLTKWGTVGIVHAETPYNNWNEFKKMLPIEIEYNGAATLQWARTKYDKQNKDSVKGIDKVLVGHTPTNSGEIEQLGNVVYADLGSFFRNKISFIEINEEFFNELS
jgi:serine/threonine protein phosphatase 1